MRPSALALVSLGLGVVAIVGCARGEDPADLVRTAFTPRERPVTPPARIADDDRPGPVMYDDLGVNLLNPDEVKEAQARAEADRRRVTGVSDAVREAVTLPSVTAAGVATTQPARTTGQYLQLGAVVTTVNGQPIYADKVLASLENVFAAEARARDERAFRIYAKNEIEKQLRSFIGAELEVAAANKNLDAREKNLADELTTRWRQQQVTLAGGSIERARAKAAAEGYDFDKLVEDKRREFLVQIYYQKRLFPRVQVTAQDMRRYYALNASRFTQRPEAKFRVIRVDAQRTGGEEPARQKIEAVRQRGVNGEDFAKLAGEVNDDPSLKRAAGDVGWVQHGAFAIEPLEEAVWKIQPGQVSEIVPVNDSFYIAKLEERKDGRVRPFEDETVQAEIEKELRKQQIDARRRQQHQQLEQDAVIYPNPPDVTPIVDMAMQKYAQWASIGGAR